MSTNASALLKNVVCPYCGAEASFVDSEIVYNGRSYGMIWLCNNYPKCDAFVGAHKDGNLIGRPKGRLANQELRTWKKEAHAVFDALWQGTTMSRSKAYRWLQKAMQLPPALAHIGEMNIEQCKSLINKLNTKSHG